MAKRATRSGKTKAEAPAKPVHPRLREVNRSTPGGGYVIGGQGGRAGTKSGVGALGGRAGLAAYAASLFRRIHGARDLGRPGDSAYFVVVSGPVYVQALAKSDGSPIQFEAASEQTVPAIAEFLSPAKRHRLTELGFQAPGARSPNYCRELEINGPPDLVRAGTLAATVLMEVFGVGDSDVIYAHVNIPRPRGSGQEPASKSATTSELKSDPAVIFSPEAEANRAAFEHAMMNATVTRDPKTGKRTYTFENGQTLTLG
jgi:hypothetical protein